MLHDLKAQRVKSKLELKSGLTQEVDKSMKQKNGIRRTFDKNYFKIYVRET